MIPKNIKREHIIKAIKKINKVGIPEGRNSKKFLLEYKCEFYPPKYVISLANKYANSKELVSQKFDGGAETNNYLKRLKFKIVENFSSAKSWEIKVKQDPKPSLARIVIAGEWNRDVATSKNLLQKVCAKWPKGKRVNYLITCGDFLNFDWPKSLTDVGNNKDQNKKTLNLLISEAKKQCDLLISKKLRKKLLRYTDFITIGIDSHKDETSINNGSIRQLDVELVALVDLKTKRYYWTGKSYPTVEQQDGLIRISDLKTHFINLKIGKVMILGCHDLNVFSPRGKAVTKSEWRKEIREGFYDIVKREKPSVILHHPHITDSSKTWTSAWNELIKTTHSVKKYISAGRYFNQHIERSCLNEVLDNTKRGDTIDFIVRLCEIKCTNIK
ncbi:MAG: hypothetical protein KA059_04180 [Elusimicrobiales bacterium]|nr:hypothetical protein [Elusimicrobiales bacterium]